MKGYEEALELVLGVEGGYSNCAWDNGGETKFGISKRAYPELNIENLEINDAKVIYYKDYWLTCSCDKMPFSIALNVFDAAVNSGQITAIKWLQKSLGVASDGVVGPQTLNAIENANIGRVNNSILSSRLDLMISHEDWENAKESWKDRLFTMARG